MIKKSLWLIAFLLLASCGPRVVSTPATAAPLTLPPTWTPVLPSAIPTVTDYPTFTPVPAFTPLPTPTTNPLEALSERFQDSLFSPSGNWVAYRDPEKLRVVNSEDKTRVWTLPCEMFKECSTVYPVRWTNGRTLYFGPAPESGSAPEGISMLTALARIDVRTGKWELVLPDSDRHYDFTFSPDQDYIGYTQSSGSEAVEPSASVGILSLGNKQSSQQEFTLEAAYAGNIVWSPFKPRFVFVTVDPEKGSGVGYYDVATNFHKYALEVARRDILISDWGPQNLVSLEFKDWDTQQRSYGVLNPFTGDLIGESITATPE
ncbi:MAG TPA: hypothetical protein VK909_17720 [Anaerolineales bacterium]|nr:hypothetical protein [Anaerolineales bacterium]